MMEIRNSIDDCSGEEWSAATRAFWEKMDEDPQYQKQNELFDTPLFDDEEDDDIHQRQTVKMLDEEHRFEQLVQVLGPYYAIGYCHGAALDILMDPDNGLCSAAIETAKVHLTRMVRLINETEGINW
jgi:hypothetical protein